MLCGKGRLNNVVVSEEKRSERLELEDNDQQFEAEEHDGRSLSRERVVQDREEGIGGDYMMEDEVEEEEEEEQVVEDDVRDELVEEYEEEHHDVVKERRKRKEFEVFVGGLDRDANEDDLREVFSQVGQITEVRLLRNQVTNKNKGFAFLRFATIEQARRAIHELKHPMVSFLFRFYLLLILI